MKEKKDAVAPWLPIDSAWWPNIAIELPKPWPRSAVLMDLRWWADQERMGRKKRPGRPALCRRWGWSDWQARATMKDEPAWKGHLQPASNSPPAAIQNTTPKPPKSQEPASSPPPTHLQPTSTRADLHKNTKTQEHTSTLSSKEDMSDSAADLWNEINKARKETGSTRDLTLTKKRRSFLKARLRKKGGRENVLRVVDWWLRSDHHRAVFVRDNYGWDTVQRKFDEYLELSYEDAKRVHDHRTPKREGITEMLARRNRERENLNVVTFPFTPSRETTNGNK